MILVTGAAGKTGNAVIRSFAAKGRTVRGLVRQPEQAAALKALGVAEISVSSFEDSEALGHAVTGVQAIYHICPNVSREELRFAWDIVRAAKAHGVTRLVYHSVLHPQIEAMPHQWQKMQVEQMLFTTGFDLTILQPTA